MVVSPAICGTIISRYGTEEQKQRWLPGHLRRHRHHGVRDHRARRRHQHPQHHHHRPPRRRRVGAQRPQDLHLRRRRGRQRAGRRAHRGRARPARSSRCLFVVPTDADGLRGQADPDGDRQPRAAVHGLPRRRPAARRRAGRRRGRRPGAAVRRAQPRADHGRVVLDRAGPVRARQGGGVRQGAHRSSRTPIGSHQAIAHPLAQSPHRDRAGPADDPEGRRALRRRRRHGRGRGRQHGEVRRRRGRLRRRRPRRADPRRQRDHPGVRHGRAAGRHPRRPDRAGQPGDDPQLRGDALPGAAEVVLRGSARKRL